MEAIMLYKEVFLFAQFMTEKDVATLMRYIGSVAFGYGEAPELTQQLQDVANTIIDKHKEQEAKYQKYRESRASNRRKKSETYENICNDMKTYGAETKPNQTKPNQTNSLSNDKEESKPRAIFKKPSIDEVKAYIKENNYELDADHWYSYYESNGWMVGKNKMKDWKAAVRTWLRNGYGSIKQGGGAPQMREHPNVLRQKDMVYTDF